MYYKVVKVQSGRYVSALHHSHSELTVEYKVGEWAKPNIDGTKLMCFGDYHSARDFAIYVADSPYKIFECQVKKPSKTAIFCYKDNCLSKSVYAHIMEALRLKKQHRKYILHESHHVYRGTVFCSEIKLLNEV